jgi:hypothetical protein
VADEGEAPLQQVVGSQGLQQPTLLAQPGSLLGNAQRGMEPFDLLPLSPQSLL